MDISQAITMNIIAVLALGSLVALLGSDRGERVVGFIGGLLVGLQLSVYGWIIYVVVHFLQKHW